ncbi:MAG: hypothetical protein DRQ55_15385 [Planctomycetota bacterium]|nr:MAG: hypothetical protein DRQ55_15385 [Planctomycetota bacterium]
MSAIPLLMPPPYATAIALLAALLSAPLAAPVSAQDAADANVQNARLMLSTEQIETEFYTPKHTHVHELLRIAERLHGRTFHVEEKGGYSAPPMDNLQLLGDSILIYDEPAYIAKVLKALMLLDRGSAPAEPDVQLSTSHWSPGFISLPTAYEALDPFKRQVTTVDSSGQSQSTRNIAMLENQRVLVLRDTPAQVAQMLELLSVIDRSEPQLMVSAMVIRGEHGAGDGAVPTELAQNLSQLVPYQSFSMEAMGLVRSSARARSIGLRLDETHSLEFEPDAFDEDSLTLSGRCQFKSETGFRFETRTSVSAGEYTVLGVSGELALFVVLRIEPIGG